MPRAAKLVHDTLSRPILSSLSMRDERVVLQRRRHAAPRRAVAVSTRAVIQANVKSRSPASDSTSLTAASMSASTTGDVDPIASTSHW